MEYTLSLVTRWTFASILTQIGLSTTQIASQPQAMPLLDRGTYKLGKQETVERVTFHE